MAARDFAFIISLSLGLAVLPLASGQASAANVSGDTIRNLNSVIKMETNEANRFEVYSRQADEEGFSEAGKLFRAMARSELILREKQRKALTDLGGQPEKVQLEDVKVRSTSGNLTEYGVKEALDVEARYAKFIEQAKKDGAQPAVDALISARSTEAQHEQLFRQALAGLGRAPAQDYYVNRTTGDLMAVPSGQALAKAKSRDYELVS